MIVSVDFLVTRKYISNKNHITTFFVNIQFIIYKYIAQVGMCLTSTGRLSRPLPNLNDGAFINHQRTTQVGSK